jgi:hypothetical protein
VSSHKGRKGKQLICFPLRPSVFCGLVLSSRAEKGIAKEMDMAGGVNAAIVPCWKCAGPAHRVYEGFEDDHYKCGECDFGFGIDWSRSGPPQSPCWPISEEEASQIRELWGRMSNP